MRKINIRQNKRDKKAVMMLLLFFFLTIFVVDYKGTGSNKEPGPKPPGVCDTDYTLECHCKDTPESELCFIGDSEQTDTDSKEEVITNKDPIGPSNEPDKPGPIEPQEPSEPQQGKLTVFLQPEANLTKIIPGDGRRVELNSAILGVDKLTVKYDTLYEVTYKSDTPFEYNDFEELPYKLYKWGDIQYDNIKGYQVLNNVEPFQGELQPSRLEDGKYLQTATYKNAGETVLKGKTRVSDNNFVLTADHEARVLEDLDIKITFTGTYK